MRTRACLLKNGVRPGPRALFSGKMPLIVSDGEIEIGSALRVWGFRIPACFGARKGARLELGDGVFINEGATVVATELISLGKHVLVADHVSIFDSTFHQVDEDTPIRRAPVRIDDNVWIGHRAMVLPGVTVGHSAVIAAGSVVTSDVKSNWLVGGVPARPIRELAASENWLRA
jgi:acetyltransferase-like isoleucine patch superfamily enzyme